MSQTRTVVRSVGIRGLCLQTLGSGDVVVCTLGVAAVAAIGTHSVALDDLLCGQNVIGLHGFINFEVRYNLNV